MDKAKELKLQRLVEFIRSHKTTHKEAREVIQSYATEVSRERAVNFHLWITAERATNGRWDRTDEELYNEWKPNQEEQQK